MIICVVGHVKMHATHCSHAYTYTKCSLRYLRAAIQIKSVHRVFILLVNVCVALHRSVAFSCTAQIRIDRPEGNSRKVDTDIASQQRQRTSHLSAFDFWISFLSFLLSLLCSVLPVFVLTRFAYTCSMNE